ncbi:MAG: hypothetical protein SOV26_03285 [Candidatus Onthovivens sp.]|nr:hypothetical protein [Candidatus Onthovivens sp.]
MKKQHFFGLLLTLNLSFLSGCNSSFFQTYANVNFSCSEGGHFIEKYNSNGRYTVGTVIPLVYETMPGFKLTSATFNGNNIIDEESFKVVSGNNEVNLTFEPINNSKQEFDTVMTSDRLTIKDVTNSQGLPLLPSVGKPKVLVVPINFPNYDSFSSEELNSMNIAFNGNSEDYSNPYWESVRGYYFKSSYETLDIQFDIAESVISNCSNEEFLKLESEQEGTGTAKILNYIYNRIKVNGESVNYKDYDLDKDGYVDGVWLIYNVRNKSTVFKEHKYWAYTYWNLKEDAYRNIEKPIFGAFSNCAYNFLTVGSKSGYDAHTLIHETGHLLGLDDYYSYDNLSYSASAMGGLDMMDLNIGDHCSFSKAALGWINPRVISTRNKEITLEKFSTTGDCVIVSQTNDSSIFDEYFIIDFYTNDNLYEFDSKNHYGAGVISNPYNTYYDYSGIRIYHVDARLMKYIDYNEGYLNYGTIKKLPSFPIYYPIYTFACSNTRSTTYKQDSEYFDFIEVISPSNIRSYENRNFGKNLKNIEDLKGLFLKGDVFSTRQQANFFNNQKLHNQSYFDLEIEVLDINENNAKIIIR